MSDRTKKVLKNTYSHGQELPPEKWRIMVIGIIVDQILMKCEAQSIDIMYITEHVKNTMIST